MIVNIFKSAPTICTQKKVIYQFEIGRLHIAEPGIFYFIRRTAKDNNLTL